MKADKDPRISNRNNWLFIAIMALFAVIVAYKLAVSPITIDLTDFKFSDLLSTVLALFAIAISLAFYFKATETSNQFYDNTYKFTKDISEILGRIETGFGERLKHLDEGYTGIRERFERIPGDPEKAKEAIKKEEEEVKKREQDFKELLEQLATRAKLEDPEKKKMFQQLHKKNRDLARAKEELSFLKTRLRRAEYRVQDDLSDLPPRMIEFISDIVIPELGGPSDVSRLAIRSIRRRFNVIQKTFNPGFMKEMRAHGLLSEERELSASGARTVSIVAILKTGRE